jgi:hypothetical protein
MLMQVGGEINGKERTSYGLAIRDVHSRFVDVYPSCLWQEKKIRKTVYILLAESVRRFS